MMLVGLNIANGDENVTRHVGDTDKTNLSTKTCHIEKGFLQILLCTYMTMCDSQRSLVEVVKKMQIMIHVYTLVMCQFCEI